MEQEESTLYSQAIHYANRMVYLRIPLDINAAVHRRTYNERDNASNSITNRWLLHRFLFLLWYLENWSNWLWIRFGMKAFNREWSSGYIDCCTWVLDSYITWTCPEASWYPLLGHLCLLELCKHCILPLVWKWHNRNKEEAVEMRIKCIACLLFALETVSSQSMVTTVTSYKLLANI